MNTKAIVALSITTGLAIGYFSFSNSSVTSLSTINDTAKQSIEHNSNEVASVNEQRQSKSQDANYQNQELRVNPNTNLEKQTSSALANSNTLAFTSSDSVNDTFLDEKNSVYNSTLEQVFKDNHFDNLISQLREVEETENSITRESNLGYELNKLNKGQLYSSEHVCRGKICAVTFSHNSADELDFDEFGNFDLNYKFSNFVQKETGETQVKIVFIQTDDPSTMSITNYMR